MVPRFPRRRFTSKTIRSLAPKSRTVVAGRPSTRRRSRDASPAETRPPRRASSAARSTPRGCPTVASTGTTKTSARHGTHTAPADRAARPTYEERGVRTRCPPPSPLSERRASKAVAVKRPSPSSRTRSVTYISGGAASRSSGETTRTRPPTPLSSATSEHAPRNASTASSHATSRAPCRAAATAAMPVPYASPFLKAASIDRTPSEGPRQRRGRSDPARRWPPRRTTSASRGDPGAAAPTPRRRAGRAPPSRARRGTHRLRAAAAPPRGRSAARPRAPSPPCGSARPCARSATGGASPASRTRYPRPRWTPSSLANWRAAEKLEVQNAFNLCRSNDFSFGSPLSTSPPLLARCRISASHARGLRGARVGRWRPQGLARAPALD